MKSYALSASLAAPKRKFDCSAGTHDPERKFARSAERRGLGRKPTGRFRCVADLLALMALLAQRREVSPIGFSAGYYIAATLDSSLHVSKRAFT